MPIVFVPNRGPHDYSAAKNYGEVRFITTGHVNRLSVSKIYMDCVKALQGASPDDYLIISSLNIITSTAAAILGHRFGRVNFLLFNRGEYVERTLYLEDQ